MNVVVVLMTFGMTGGAGMIAIALWSGSGWIDGRFAYSLGGLIVMLLPLILLSVRHWLRS